MRPQVRGSAHSLLMFADIIDSSKFGAVLEYEEYADRVLEFQESFIALGRRYFPKPADTTVAYCRVEARGDEGTIFVMDVDEDPPDLVLRAIEFLMHLKGCLKMTPMSQQRDKSPTQIGLGAGIHFGTVAYATSLDRDNHAQIARLEGFAINYAKRVESSSRDGGNSRIMLSEAAFRLVEGAPVTFKRILTPMKGIGECVEVYEVCGGIFRIQIAPKDQPGEQRLVARCRELAAQPGRIDEQWMKSLIISVLDQLIQQPLFSQQRSEYQRLQEKLAWYSCDEDDPVLLFIRARMYGAAGQHTQQLRYLREILQRYPGFVHVKKAMIEACSVIAKCGAECLEKVYARDMAREFLERYPELLDSVEREKFESVIRELGTSLIEK